MTENTFDNNSRYLRIYRSQIFQVPIPEKVSDEEIEDLIHSGDMYSDKYFDLMGYNEVAECDYGDEWIELVNGDNGTTKQIISYY